MNRSSMLPIVMVIVIVFVILMTITAERTNAPTVTADRDYPHQICTTNRYCTGPECSDEPISFVVYLSYTDGEPRLELPGWNPKATLTETVNGLEINSTGGDISGRISIYKDRVLDITATSLNDDGVVAHFASGSCLRLHTP